VSLPVRIRAEANAELNAAWNWYENQRDGLGDDLLGCVDAAFAAVAKMLAFEGQFSPKAEAPQASA